MIGVILFSLSFGCFQNLEADSGAGYRKMREFMIESQIQARGVRSSTVLKAMERVPRHLYVPDAMKSYAYEDRPLPIGHGQTISQPYIVAAMTELLKVDKDDKVLEVGTGSGYQAAVLAEIVDRVYTIEIVETLGREAARKLASYNNVTTHIGDGYLGWSDQAPFDAIIVTAAPEEIPPPLIEQLKPGGRMVIPVGPVHDVQKLLLVVKNADGTLKQEYIMAVRFVPLTGDR